MEPQMELVPPGLEGMIVGGAWDCQEGLNLGEEGAEPGSLLIAPPLPQTGRTWLWAPTTTWCTCTRWTRAAARSAAWASAR